ncbi:MAG TPA: cob(I)yrinic acid a,c-diamide adenosyltransferase, partial [Acidobacteriaceae bacterium]
MSDSESPRRGLILINTGPGKGKTTAALGTAFRAAGNGMRVLFLQFLKGSWHYGELDAAETLNAALTPGGPSFPASAERVGSSTPAEQNSSAEAAAAHLEAIGGRSSSGLQPAEQPHANPGASAPGTSGLETTGTGTAKNFVIKQLGRGFVKIGGAETDPEDIRLVEAAWDEAAAAILSGEWDLVVLDEINYAIGYKMLAPERVADVLRRKPEMTHVILTGRNAHSLLVELADTVTEMREVKHAYQKGI